MRAVEDRPRSPFCWDRRRFYFGRSQIVEAIPPHFRLIVHPIMTQKESKVIVMIALGSLFFWRLKGESMPFGSPFFIFWGISELQSPIAHMVRIGRTSGRGLRGTISNCVLIPPQLSTLSPNNDSHKSPRKFVSPGSFFICFLFLARFWFDLELIWNFFRKRLGQQLVVKMVGQTTRLEGDDHKL